ncbi:hypothetical protein LSAT2_028913 [Lamellibrachia satsuma]|nr:hypothetical protein LSAT2_028913 [Lamellibrachia satsuma]
MVEEILPADKVSVIAHRGGGHDAPENTLAAFREAKKNGADGVEFDMDFTRDGIAVLLHDQSVNRTTSGSGKLSHMTFAEVRQLDASANHPHKDKYPNEKIPTLEEAVVLCLELKLKMFIDVKDRTNIQKNAQKLHRMPRSYAECPGATQNAQELRRMPRSYTECPGATQNAQELRRMPRSYAECLGATQNAQELRRMLRSYTECPGATQNAQELHRMPRSYKECPGATQNAQEVHRMPRRYTECPGATQHAQELRRMPRSYTECPGATQNAQELRRMPRSYAECPGATQNAQELHRMPRSYAECPGATQNAQELHRMPRSYAECPGAMQNAQELHRMPRSYAECPGATQNAQELQRMPRSYTECPGATQHAQELRSFLGLIHYNQNFLHNLSTMLAPLHELTHQHVKWKWGLRQKKVFEEAKALLSSSKMLVHYNPELPIIVCNDASPYGIGRNAVRDAKSEIVKCLTRKPSMQEPWACSLGHELSPIPTSMFDENGNMRDAKMKSNLKNVLKVEVSRRLAEQDVQATFLDGCAVLWVVPWSTSATVHNYLVRFRSYLDGHLAKSDVYLVFDRYIEGSTKEVTRCGRDKGASRVYTLRCTARLPPQKVVLTVTTNKDQLIALIIEDLVSHQADFQKHKLVITGRDPVPVEIANGCVNKHQDMAITQEEGDTLIVQQISRVEDGTVLVVADDTDIFVLLLYFCHQEDGSTTLSPTTVPPDTSLAQTGLLKLIKCSCQSEMPCSTNKCSCNSSDMACTPFCACQGGQACQNESGKYVLHDKDDED